MKKFLFKSRDGSPINTYAWIPEGEVKALLQIAHGVVEHAGRYDLFAGFMNKNGIAVYANDHRGHGLTAQTKEDLGFFAEQEGWDLCVDDMHTLSKHMKTIHGDLPLFLLGHSMGSFLSRTYASIFGKELHGLILSGTATHPPILIALGKQVALMQAFFRGKRHRSQLLSKMSFGAFNKRYKNPITPFDWVSRDPEVARKYMADDFCGFTCTTGLFIDLMKGIRYMNSRKCFMQCPTQVPVLIFSGTEDPVGEYGKGPTEVHKRYLESGLTDVMLKLYPDGRHEMLLEINKDEVFSDVSNWIFSKLKQKT